MTITIPKWVSMVIYIIVILFAFADIGWIMYDFNTYLNSQSPLGEILRLLTFVIIFSYITYDIFICKEKQD